MSLRDRRQAQGSCEDAHVCSNLISRQKNSGWKAYMKQLMSSPSSDSAFLYVDCACWATTGFWHIWILRLHVQGRHGALQCTDCPVGVPYIYIKGSHNTCRATARGPRCEGKHGAEHDLACQRWLRPLFNLFGGWPNVGRTRRRHLGTIRGGNNPLAHLSDRRVLSVEGGKVDGACNRVARAGWSPCNPSRKSTRSQGKEAEWPGALIPTWAAVESPRRAGIILISEPSALVTCLLQPSSSFKTSKSHVKTTSRRGQSPLACEARPQAALSPHSDCWCAHAATPPPRAGRSAGSTPLCDPARLSPPPPTHAAPAARTHHKWVRLQACKHG